MARVKNNKSSRIEFKLTPGLKAQFFQKCTKEGVVPSQVLVERIEMYLEEVPVQQSHDSINN